MGVQRFDVEGGIQFHSMLMDSKMNLPAAMGITLQNSSVAPAVDSAGPSMNKGPGANLPALGG
jgi:hypothetical protein